VKWRVWIKKGSMDPCKLLMNNFIFAYFGINVMEKLNSRKKEGSKEATCGICNVVPE